MKKPVVIAMRGKNPASMGSSLRKCGFAVEIFSEPEEFQAAVANKVPDIVLVDSDYPEQLCQGITCPVLRWRAPLPGSGGPDIFDLCAALQNSLPGYPRRGLRVSVELPCLFLWKKECVTSRIVSIGADGAFIRTGCLPLKAGERVKVVISLAGTKTEMEIPGEVVHRLVPERDNNFGQGIGIRFRESGEDDHSLRIRRYLQSLFIDDYAAEEPYF